MQQPHTSLEPLQPAEQLWSKPGLFLKQPREPRLTQTDATRDFRNGARPRSGKLREGIVDRRSLCRARARRFSKKSSKTENFAFNVSAKTSRSRSSIASKPQSWSKPTVQFRISLTGEPRNENAAPGWKTIPMVGVCCAVSKRNGLVAAPPTTAPRKLSPPTLNRSSRRFKITPISGDGKIQSSA